MSNAAFLAASGITHAGSSTVTIVSGGLSVPAGAGGETFTVLQASVATKLVSSGRISFELLFVPTDTGVGNTLFGFAASNGDSSGSASGANGLMRGTAAGSQQDAGTQEGTLFGFYFGPGETMKHFWATGGNLALRTASSDNGSVQSGTGPTQAGNCTTAVDYRVFNFDGVMTVAGARAYTAGTKPSWVP